jgi:hypothetical protein
MLPTLVKREAATGIRKQASRCRSSNPVSQNYGWAGLSTPYKCGIKRTRTCSFLSLVVLHQPPCFTSAQDTFFHLLDNSNFINLEIFPFAFPERKPVLTGFAFILGGFRFSDFSCILVPPWLLHWGESGDPDSSPLLLWTLLFPFLRVLYYVGHFRTYYLWKIEKQT